MVPGEVLIRAESVGKRFCRSLRRAMWYGLTDLGRELAASSPRDLRRLRAGEFLALEEVSFELRRGEALALIGPNGAGKSTLLKLLNGLMKPDAGRITVRGEVGALIELGAGFNPVLTGRENIHVAGAVLGMSRKQVERRFDEIVAFAELGEFIDSPLQSYSSGMKVRLGFSVAAHMEPDVLLIDEVLAVGDVGFRAKCYNRIHDLAARTAVVFVSHSMQHVSRLCSRAMVLHRGQVLTSSSDVPSAIRDYLGLFEMQGRVIEMPGCAVHRITIGGQDAASEPVLDFGRPVSFEADLSLPVGEEVEVSWSVNDTGMALVAQLDSFYNGTTLSWSEARARVTTTVPALPLNPGRYFLSLVIRRLPEGEMLCWHHATLPFRVEGPFYGAAPVQLSGDWRVDLVGAAEPDG